MRGVLIAAALGTAGCASLLGLDEDFHELGTENALPETGADHRAAGESGAASKDAADGGPGGTGAAGGPSDAAAKAGAGGAAGASTDGGVGGSAGVHDAAAGSGGQGGALPDVVEASGGQSGADASPSDAASGDASIDVAPETAPDAHVDASIDAGLDAAPDVAPDGAPDVVPDVPPEVPAEHDYRKSITVDRSKVGIPVGPVMLIDYQVLVSFVDPALADISHGGHVESANGFDIFFRGADATTCGGPASCVLSHEMEAYDPATGAVRAWVRARGLTTQTAATNTRFYIHYGDASITTPTENPHATWDASWAAVYHLREDPSGAAPQIIDSTSNQNHATSGGGMTSASLVPGQVGTGVFFDGIDDGFTAPHSASLTLLLDVTMSGWMKVSTASNLPQIVGYGALGETAPDNFLYSLYYAPSGPWKLGEFHEHGTGSNDDFLSISLAADPAETWEYFAVSRKTATMALQFFVDGKALGAAVPYVNSAFDGSGAVLYIGRDEGVANFAHGALDEVRVANVVRSPAQIATDFQSQGSPGTFFSMGSEEIDPP